MKGSLRQRSPGSWELTIDTGRDALGRRQRKFVTVRGTKAQAQRRLRELLSNIDRGIPPIPDKTLLRDWLDRWMAEVIAPNRRQGTKERYRDIIDRYINPYIGHIPLANVGPAQIQALETELSRRLSPKGVGQAHNVLSGAMKHALRQELVQRNSVSLVSPPAVRRQEVPPPDIQAVRAALDLARWEDHDLFPAMYLIAYTGLRRGEALGLLWEHVDLDRGFVTVEGSLVRSRERGLILEPPKTNAGRRMVDLDSSTVEVLAEHRRAQAETRAMMREAYDHRGRVFADAIGGWVHPQRLYTTVKSYGRRVGHGSMSVRSLRHFHASLMLQNRENIVVVSKRLGHANVSITSDIYAHALPGWQKQAAEAFAKVMDADTDADNADDSIPPSTTAHT